MDFFFIFCKILVLDSQSISSVTLRLCFFLNQAWTEFTAECFSYAGLKGDLFFHSCKILVLDSQSISSVTLRLCFFLNQAWPEFTAVCFSYAGLKGGFDILTCLFRSFFKFEAAVSIFVVFRFEFNLKTTLTDNLRKKIHGKKQDFRLHRIEMPEI